MRLFLLLALVALSANAPKRGGEAKDQHSQQSYTAPGPAVPNPTGPNPHQERQQGCPGTNERRFDCNSVAAEAAVRQAEAAEQQASLALGGLIAGIATTIAAFFAARYAKKAANEAERSVDAALKAVAESQAGNEIARSGNRPIMAFAGFAMRKWNPSEDELARPEVSVRGGFLLVPNFINIGPMPALPLSCEVYRSYTIGNPKDADIEALTQVGPGQRLAEGQVVGSHGPYEGPGIMIHLHHVGPPEPGSLSPTRSGIGRIDRGEGSATAKIGRYHGERFALIVVRLRYRSAIGVEEWETEQIAAIMPKFSDDGYMRLDDLWSGPPQRVKMT